MSSNANKDTYKSHMTLGVGHMTLQGESKLNKFLLACPDKLNFAGTHRKIEKYILSIRIKDNLRS